MSDTSAAAASAPTTSSPAFGPAGGRDDPAGVLLGQPFPWGVVLATGILAMAFGVAVLVWPEVSLKIMATLAGVWLLTAGIARIIAAVLPGSGSIVGHLFSGVVGVVLLIAGLLCLRDLVTRLSVLALLFTISWILGGIAQLILGLQHTGAVRLALIVVGSLSLIAGVVFLVTPKLSLATLVVLTGISALVVGLSEIVLALALRRVRGQQALAEPPVALGQPT